MLLPIKKAELPSSRTPEGAFDDMPFIDALHANDL
jgi:hypothetical protein